MMAKYGLTEPETWTIITQAVNFGMTQLVDGNWGMHAVIPKSIFEGVERNAACSAVEEPIEEILESEDEDEEEDPDDVMGYHDHDGHDHGHSDHSDEASMDDSSSNKLSWFGAVAMACAFVVLTSL